MDVRQTLGGRYKLLNELGSGGMAVVWRARDEVLGRSVAVKLLAARYAGDPQSRARIRAEARAAATLSHPNIAQVYDFGEATEASGTTLPYVVMELINGPTLQQRVASGPLPPRTVFRICGEVAAALAAAHADGLVHRDIKMANIMVTAGGAKVVDFGIAAAVGRAPEEMVVGTPAYLAPERLTGDAVLPASDVYALGVLLYRLLTNESPWTVETTTQMLQAHVYVEPAPLPPLPAVPPAVVALIARCLQKDPEARPTASEVSATLADAAEAADNPVPVRGEPAGPSARVPHPATGAADDLGGGPSDVAAGVETASGRRGGDSADARRRTAGGAISAAGTASAGGMASGGSGPAGGPGAADAVSPAGGASLAGGAAAASGLVVPGGGPGGVGEPGGWGAGRQRGRGKNGGRGAGSNAGRGGEAVGWTGASGRNGGSSGVPGNARSGGNGGIVGSGQDDELSGISGNVKPGVSGGNARTAGGAERSGIADIAKSTGMPGPRDGDEVSDIYGNGGPGLTDAASAAAGAESARRAPEETGRPGRDGADAAGRVGVGGRADAAGRVGADGRSAAAGRVGADGRSGAAGRAGADGRGRDDVRVRPAVAGRGGPRAAETVVDFGLAGGLPGGSVRAGRGGAGGRGSNPVRLRERKGLLAGAGAVAVIVALLAGWGLLGDGEPERKIADVAPASVAPAVSRGGAARPETSASSAGQVAAPVETAMPGRPSASASRSAGASQPAAVPGTSASAASPEPSESEAEPSAAASPEGKRLTSPGGSVHALCGQGKVTLTAWQAADGFEVQKVDPGPKLTAVIVFAGNLARYRMSVTCVAGSPTPVVLPL